MFTRLGPPFDAFERERLSPRIHPANSGNGAVRLADARGQAPNVPAAPTPLPRPMMTGTPSTTPDSGAAADTTKKTMCPPPMLPPRRRPRVRHGDAALR